MAFSSTRTELQQLGQVTLQIHSVDFAGVTSGHIKTGMARVRAAFFNNEGTEAQGIVKINKASDGSTAEGGGIYISDVTSGDTGTLTVIGA